jgi:hypothetical protein
VGSSLCRTSPRDSTANARCGSVGSMSSKTFACWIRWSWLPPTSYQAPGNPRSGCAACQSPAVLVELVRATPLGRALARCREGSLGRARVPRLPVPQGGPRAVRCAGHAASLSFARRWGTRDGPEKGA